MPPVKRACHAIFLGLLISCCGVLWAQVAAPLSAPPVESLPISPGDLLHVTVFDVPELEQHARVLDSGTVKLALIGEVHVAGETPASASSLIADLFTRRGFLRDPSVSVLVEQFAAAGVSVTGQVAHPGIYQIATPRTLMDVISLAGGLTPLADIHVTVQRGDGTGAAMTAAMWNDPHRALGDAVEVRPGDLVIVPKAGLVYVLGDVNRPGGYVMQDDAKLTVLQAIALASGTAKTASEHRAKLVRQSAQGPVEQTVPLLEMQKGQAPDIPLQAEDVLYIPFSTAKNVMLGAAAILSSTSGAAIYAAH